VTLTAVSTLAKLAAPLGRPAAVVAGLTHDMTNTLHTTVKNVLSPALMCRRRSAAISWLGHARRADLGISSIRRAAP